MAVVQISRIQIRRGKANTGTGFPQLASGEMGWAVDTQELYIGNGSVAEGAPAVGNTKILTQNDFTAQGSILNLIQYIYKSNDPTIFTGPDANSPIERPIQDRLSDRVTTADFGAVADGSTDDTAAIQRAINQLFLNSATKASANTTAGATARVVLEMPAGRYVVTRTIYVPSYATIVGAGLDKTIIEFTGTGPVIQFVNDDAVIGDTPGKDTVTNISTTSFGNTQPRFITIRGLTVFSDTGDQTAIQLDAVRDSLFEDIGINGSWIAGVPNPDSKGIDMTAVSSQITCQNNTFRRLHIDRFNYAVYARHDILNNTFEDCLVTNTNQGFVLGEDIDLNVGQQFGPRETVISSSKFIGVARHAVIVVNGSSNSVINSELTNVGNGTAGEIAAHASATYPQIYFNREGNAVTDIRSDRPAGLANDNPATPYVPEVTGVGTTYSLFGTRKIQLVQSSSPQTAFRLPLAMNSAGDPVGTINYTIDYVFRSNSETYSRRGVISLLVDVETSNVSGTSIVQLTDEYDYAGTLSEEASLKLDFTAKLTNEIGATFVGPTGQDPFSIVVEYANPAGEPGLLSYTYTAVVI